MPDHLPDPLAPPGTETRRAEPGREERFRRAEQLLEQFFEQRAALGDAAARFEDFLAPHSELGSELRELWSRCGEVDRALVDGQHTFAAQAAEIQNTLDELRRSAEFERRYAIQGEVGKGGMGAVFRVVDRTLDRPLAMKVILGQASASRSGKTPPIAPRQLRRFLNEAKITSQLDHPGIVPVHEVGVDDGGRAYFTMKLVQGRTLGEVFRRGATEDPEWTRPRVLTLIQRVCEALAYAHERGVIHRDLKPANVMVGDFGEVYVMDWGLARRIVEESEEPSDVGASVEPDPLEAELTHTREGAVLGTPAYMPPEQAAGRIEAMGPHSDIYALGAMLYQLLTGFAPYCEPGRDASSTAVLLRIVQGPPRRLAVKGTPPELAAICEKAMQREPRDRYGNARELARDLERFQAGLTVKAFRTGGWSELEKWVRRNKALSGALAAVLAVSVIGAVAFGIKAKAAEAAAELARAEEERADAKAKEAETNATEARLARDAAQRNALLAQESAATAREREREARASEARATRVTELVQGALIGSDPNQGGSQAHSVVEAMEAAILDLESGTLRDDPETEAALQMTISQILEGNGGHEKALTLAEQALATRRRLHPGDHRELALSQNRVASCLDSLGRSEEAVAMLETSLEVLRRLSPGDDTDVAGTLNDLAYCLDSLGRFDEALPRYEEALAMKERLFSGDHEQLALALNNVATCLDSLAQSSEALPLHEATLEMRRRLFPGDHPAVAESLNNVAFCLQYLGRTTEALTQHEAALEHYRRVFPGDHPAVARSLDNVGGCLQALGRPGEALSRHEAGLEMRRRLFPDGHPDVATSLNNLAACLHRLDRKDETLSAFEEALEEYERFFPGDNPDVAMAHNNLGACLVSLGRFSEALQEYEIALQMYQRVFSGDHPSVANSMGNMARCLDELGRGAEALLIAEEADAMARRILPEGDDLRELIVSNLARIRASQPQ